MRVTEADSFKYIFSVWAGSDFVAEVDLFYCGSVRELASKLVMASLANRDGLFARVAAGAEQALRQLAARTEILTRFPGLELRWLAHSDEVPDEELLDLAHAAYDSVLRDEADFFAAELGDLNGIPLARAVLDRIARGEGAYTARKDHPERVRRALDALVERCVLRKVGRGRYAFEEPLLRAHLLDPKPD